MTLEIRAKVQRHPKVGGTPNGEPWLALVYTIDPDPAEECYSDTYDATWCGSLPEALQAVLLMRRNLERQLMDEVHASRASRRVQRCEECGEVVHEGKVHFKLSDDPCMILPAAQLDPDIAEMTYTSEATA